VFLLAVVLAACETAAPAAPSPAPTATAAGSPTPSPVPASPTEVSVAFIQDLSPEGALDRTLPALQAVELAFATASIEADPVEVGIVSFDTRGEDATAGEIAAQIASDPTYVAAIAAPGVGGQAELVEALTAADVPLLSLSSRGSVEGAPPGMWLRFVAPIEAQARALALAVPTIRASRRGVCLVAVPPDGTTYAQDVRRLLPEDVVVVEAKGGSGVAAGGCGVALWTGDAEGGAELASADRGGAMLVGGSGLRDPAFLSLAGGAAEGAMAFCSCADVSTSLRLAAQRFIQDFQSEYGSPPGPYAVESWDAAHLLIRAVRQVGSTRAALVSWLASTTAVEGLAGSYAFEGGELVDPASAIRRFVVEGGRWEEVSLPGDALA